MKPTSQPSFTRRPIHQSLLYFCGPKVKPSQSSAQLRPFPPVWTFSYLFDVQEIFGFEGNGHALHRDVVAGAGIVTDICPHGERHWFGLGRQKHSQEKAPN